MNLEDVAAQRGRVSRQTWEQEMLCRQPKWADAVFGGFSRARHVRAFEVRPDGGIVGQSGAGGGGGGVTWICGVDFGYAGAFVCLWIGVVRGLDGVKQAYVAGELVQKRERLDVCVGEMKRRMGGGEGAGGGGGMPRPGVVFCDIAGLSANSQTGMSDVKVLREAGFNVKYSQQEIRWGLEVIGRLVQDGAGAAGLTVHPRCAGLIAALEGYRWGDSRAHPEKDGVHDHPMDALRYALWGAEGKGSKVEVRGY